MLITPEVTFSYPSLWEAKLRKNPNPKDKPKFGLSSLFTAEGYADPLTEAIRAAVIECAVLKWGRAAFETMLREEQFESPFRKDISSKGYPAHFVRYISSESGIDYPPAVLDRAGKPLMDKRAVYAGVIGRVSLSPRAYGGPGTTYKPGVKLDLRNVQILRDGERLTAGGTTGGTEFGAVDPLPPGDMAADAPLAGMLD